MRPHHAGIARAACRGIEPRGVGTPQASSALNVTDIGDEVPRQSERPAARYVTSAHGR